MIFIDLLKSPNLNIIEANLINYLLDFSIKTLYDQNNLIFFSLHYPKSLSYAAPNFAPSIIVQKISIFIEFILFLIRNQHSKK